MSGEKFPIWKRGRDFHVSGLKRGTFIKRRIVLPSKSAISGPLPRLTPLKQILPLARVEMSSGGKARDYCDRRPSVREIEAATSVIRKIPLRLRRNASQSHFLSRTKTPRLSRWATGGSGREQRLGDVGAESLAELGKGTALRELGKSIREGRDRRPAEKQGAEGLKEWGCVVHKQCV